MEYHYEVLRPLWFFCEGQSIMSDKMKLYYTDLAIEAFERDGFIKKVEGLIPLKKSEEQIELLSKKNN